MLYNYDKASGGRHRMISIFNISKWNIDADLPPNIEKAAISFVLI